jgi:predicted nuclease with TOPRIM domain
MGILYTDALSEKNNIRNDYIEVQHEYQTLNQSYMSLQSNYDSLDDEHQQLQANYSKMQQQYTDLQSDNDDLQVQLNSLQTNYSVLNKKHNNLTSQYTSLQVRLVDLQGGLDAMNTSYQSLLANYTSLESDNEALLADLNSLQYQYTSLQSDYNSLQLDYTALQNGCNSLENKYEMLESTYNIESTLRVGHLLDDYYEVIRGKYQPEGWWLFFPNDQEQVDFAADIAGHGLKRIYWPADEDEFYDASYNSYGYYIHSYDEAYNELVEIKNLIGIEPYDSDATKVKKILDFINDNIHYEHDMNENFLAPMETIGLKSGDCEDFSILAGALFEMVGIESAIAFTNSHAFVLVKMSSLSPYSSFWYYSDLTGYGLSSGRWIKIEPQVRIEQQYSYTEHLILKVAAEIDN